MYKNHNSIQLILQGNSALHKMVRKQTAFYQVNYKFIKTRMNFYIHLNISNNQYKHTFVNKCKLFGNCYILCSYKRLLCKDRVNDRQMYMHIVAVLG